MLNVFRENLRHLKWILWLVALTFVIFFGTAWYLVDPSEARPWIARVNGEQVSSSDWSDTARRLDEQYRRMFGQQYEQIRANIDVAMMAAEELVGDKLVVQDARRMGLTVPDAELASFIRNLPGLQRDGVFIGNDEYKRAIRQGLLGNTRNPEEFEDQVREGLLANKWQGVLLASIVVTPAEIEAEFRRRNERSTFEYIAVPLDRYEKAIAPGPGELESWYEARRDRYAVGEARRALYVLLDDATVGDRVQIDDAAIRQYYEQNQQLFTRAEERRARQILIAVQPDAPADEVERARTKARSVADRLRAGEDFATVARETSDDEFSAAQGGDLGFFPRGQMVPEFDEAVFAAQQGVVSDPVRTDYGFHIIRVEEIRASALAPLEEVTNQIRAQIRFQKSRDVAKQVAKELHEKALASKDLRAAALEMNLPLKDSGLVSRADNVPGLGPVPEMIEKIFATESGGIGDIVELPSGEVVLTVTEVVTDHLPALDTQRERVLAEFARERARDEASSAVRAAVATAGGDLARAAKRLDVEVQTTTPAYIRGQGLAGIGASPALERAAFTSPPGVLSEPVDAGRSLVVLRVISRDEADMGRLAQESDAIRDFLRAPRAQRLITATRERLRKEAQVEFHPELLASSQASQANPGQS